MSEIDLDSIQSKVQKLLALGQSSNVHEAELALLKANKLILKHNIKNLKECNTASSVVREVLFPNITRRPMLQKAIALMLQTFGVYVVLNNQRGGGIYLYGTKENTTVARYASDFLVCEMPRLFRHSGLDSKCKSSFYMGVAQGYLQKMENLSNAQSQSGSTALTVVASTAREVALKELSSVNENKQINYKIDVGYGQGYRAGTELSVMRPVETSCSAQI